MNLCDSTKTFKRSDPTSINKKKRDSYFNIAEDN